MRSLRGVEIQPLSGRELAPDRQHALVDGAHRHMRIPVIVPRQLHVFEAAELLDRVSGKGHELGFIVAVIAPKMAQRMIGGGIGRSRLADRKSTRSELQSLMRISYAVFC